MAEQSKSDRIQDASLEAWLTGEGDDVREVIVEAKVPPRTVRFSGSASARLLPEEVTSSGEGNRTAILQELQDYLAGLLGTSPPVLWAAGAIAARVNRAQLRELMKHPLVKAVRDNRRLGRARR
jgi:hypothetical protein